jgi:hypothetical protein
MDTLPCPPKNRFVGHLSGEVFCLERKLSILQGLYAEMVATISLDGNSNEPVSKLRKNMQLNIRDAMQNCGMPQLSGLLIDQQNSEQALGDPRKT